MAAKRLGSALSDLEGTSKQLLRVKADESGFEFYTPASLPSYTVTNGTEDRTFDADETSIDEIADVLATLIDDIDTIISGGPVAFKWSTSEQVYPLHLAEDGSPLYCMKIECGALPNTGFKNVSHSIVNLDTRKVESHRFHVFYPSAAGTNMVTTEYPDHPELSVRVTFHTDHVEIWTGQNWATYSANLFVIYSK